MTHKILFLGNPDNIKVPSPFLLESYPFNHQWEIEVTHQSYSAVILRPEDKTIEQISQYIEPIYSQNQNLSLIVELTSKNKEDVQLLVNRFPGIKLTNSLANNNIKSLLPNLQKLNKKWLQQTYQNVLTQLNRASNLRSIEQSLVQSLKSALDIATVRLVFAPHSQHYISQIESSHHNYYVAENLSLSSSPVSLVFVRNTQEKFNKTEINLLEKIAEAGFLSLKRTLRLEHLETLEQHWNATFNAFDAGIGVLNKKGHFIRVNDTFEKYFGSKLKKLSELEKNFHWPPTEKDQQFSFKNCRYSASFHPYIHGWIIIVRDITEKMKLERQILESNKMAELGMISSSIAHEINNPLGGILSYLQLIKMDLDKNSQYYPDIHEMEQATYKCKSIVEQLLGFARNHSSTDQQDFDLNELAMRAIDLCQIPIRHGHIEVTNVKETLGAANNFSAPFVFKADGLAAGKGVFICKDIQELEIAARSIFEEKSLGSAGNVALLEKFQPGWELSYLVLTNGRDFRPLPLAQDHKRLLENNEGPNTGGMGAVAPLAIDLQLEEEIHSKIIQPIIKHLEKLELDYRGVLYVGIMVTDSGPSVLEINVRFGDPEAQVLLPLLDGDWGEVFYNLAKGELSVLSWKPMFASCIVLAAPGYPKSSQKDVVIEGDLKFESPSSYFLHAGSKTNAQNEWVTEGGRVLNAIGLGSDLKESLQHSYAQANKVSWSGLQMRKDIGAKL